MERSRIRPGSAAFIGRVAAALAVVTFLTACGQSGGATIAPTSPATSAPPVAATAGATSAAGLTLEVAEADVGTYVAGEGGKALYIFTPDSGDTSACTGDCATNWPPLVVVATGDVSAGSGVTGELGTITRDDGSLQVTLGGAPLYYFKNDSASGQTNGQGVNDVWYLAAPDGKGIGAPANGGGRDY